MKAALLTALERIEVREIPDPRLPDESNVIVNVRAVGICGSDVHYYTHGRIGRQIVQYPFIVGHEGSGTIESVGRDVKGLSPGDNVVLEPAISCGECDQCRAGRENTCRKIRFISCPGEAQGCLCSKIAMPARNCHRLPDVIPFDLAAFAEPLSIGIYSVKNSGEIRNARIAVLGCGPIGLSVIIAAKFAGAGEIFATDKLDCRLEAARRLGADLTGNPLREDVGGKMVSGDGGEPGIVFECSGDQAAIDQSLEILRPGGRLVILGIPGAGRISFDPDHFRRKEITAFYVRRQNRCVPEAISIIESRMEMISPLVTHRFPIARCNEAFRMVAGYSDGVIKAAIMP